MLVQVDPTFYSNGFYYYCWCKTMFITKVSNRTLLKHLMIKDYLVRWGKSYQQEQFRPPALLLLSPLSCPMADRLLHAAARHAHPFWEHKPGRKLLPSALEPDAFGLKRPIGTRRSHMPENERRSVPKASRYRSPYPGKLDNVAFKSTCMCYSGTLDLASGGVAYFPSIELLRRKELMNLLFTARHAHPFWEHKPGRKLLPSALEPDAFGLKRPIGTRRSHMPENERRSVPKASRYRSPYPGKLDNVAFKSTCMCYSGTLDLASGGVAYFPSIELLRRKELMNLLFTLENINVGSTVLSDGKVSQQVNNARTNLTCMSIWATLDITPDRSRKISERLSSIEDTPLVVSSTDEVHSANELISRRKGLQRVLCAFDLIVNMETAGGEDEILDSLLADHWLRGSMTCVSNTNRDDAIGNTTQIFDSVLSSYNASATPEIPPDVSRLLQAYYLAVRRSCTNDRYAVPSTALTTLIKMCRTD
ncbi:hypothetical protein AHF37_05366 [Paragonimus kellicotti]|nr:hypothetical protein AHF37_05366 [Paragonimus kellicotti]